MLLLCRRSFSLTIPFLVIVGLASHDYYFGFSHTNGKTPHFSYPPVLPTLSHLTSPCCFSPSAGDTHAIVHMWNLADLRINIPPGDGIRGKRVHELTLPSTQHPFCLLVTPRTFSCLSRSSPPVAKLGQQLASPQSHLRT